MVLAAVEPSLGALTNDKSSGNKKATDKSM